jgi:hypothetical protein
VQADDIVADLHHVRVVRGVNFVVPQILYDKSVVRLQAKLYWVHGAVVVGDYAE